MIVGALLAGGASRRAGGDKAALSLDGATLGARALATLRAACDQVVICGHGRGLEAAWAGAGHDVPRLDDATEGAGPLAGALAALRYGAAVGADRVLLVPVDMPGLTAPLLTALAATAGLPTDGCAAALLRADGRLVALPLCLRPAHAAALEDALRTGGGAILTALSTLPLRLLRLDDDAAADVLANVNATPAAAAAPWLQADGVRSERWREVAGHTLRRGEPALAGVAVAAEAPLQLLLGPLPIAVLMRTPGDDLDLARGFALTERIVDDPAALAAVAYCDEVEDSAARGHVVRLTLQAGARPGPGALQRASFVGSSCGICGKESVERALQTAPPLPPGQPPWPAALLDGLGDRLRGLQPLFAATGGCHGVGLFDRGGALRLVREDVGRHNATDKVLGAAAAGEAGLRWPCTGLGLLVSGRISFEIVQKALAAGIDLVVGVSAPTTLAIELGEAAGVCVVGFCRGHRATIFAAARRVEGLTAEGAASAPIRR